MNPIYVHKVSRKLKQNCMLCMRFSTDFLRTTHAEIIFVIKYQKSTRYWPLELKTMYTTKFYGNQSKNALIACTFLIFSTLSLISARAEIIFVIKYQMSAMALRICVQNFMQIGAKMRALRPFLSNFSPLTLISAHYLRGNLI